MESSIFVLKTQNFIQRETVSPDLIWAQKTRGAIDRSRGLRDFLVLAKLTFRIWRSSGEGRYSKCVCEDEGSLG